MTYLTATKWTECDIDKIRAALLATPPPAAPMTTAEALRKLAPDLSKMRASGHTAASIASALGQQGLTVSARAVARALAGAAAKPRRQRAAVKASQPPGQPAQD